MDNENKKKKQLTKDHTECSRVVVVVLNIPAIVGISVVSVAIMTAAVATVTTWNTA